MVSIRDWIKDVSCEVGIHIMDPSTDEVLEVNGYVRTVQRQCSNCDHTSEVEQTPGRWSRRSKPLL